MNVRFGSRLLAVAVLLSVYLLTLGSLAVGDIAIGLVLAISMELGWRHRISRGGTIGSPADDGSHRPPLHRALLALPRLLLAVAGDITRGTWEVAKYSIGLREVERDGIIELELEGVSEEGMATWAFISTVSPGEVVLDVDEERGVLVIHVLDTSDEEEIRARHHEFYERYQRKVVP